MAEARSQLVLWCQLYSCTQRASSSPQAWWDLVQRAGGYPDLVKLGTAMADAVPHAASLERVFSLMGWLHSKLRNRQKHETTTAMTTIRTHWQRRTAKVIPANALGQTSAATAPKEALTGSKCTDVGRPAHRCQCIS